MLFVSVATQEGERVENISVDLGSAQSTVLIPRSRIVRVFTAADEPSHNRNTLGSRLVCMEVARGRCVVRVTAERFFAENNISFIRWSAMKLASMNSYDPRPVRICLPQTSWDRASPS